MENLMSVPELAKELNVPISWVYSRCMEKGPESIPRLKLGKYVRFERAKVMAWVRGRNQREDE